MLRFYLFNSGVESSGDAAVDAINLDTTNKAPKVSMAIGLPVTVTGCPARRLLYQIQRIHRVQVILSFLSVLKYPTVPTLPRYRVWGEKVQIGPFLTN